MKQHTNTPEHSFKLKAISFLIGLAETQRLVDEEGRSGGRSGLGSGKCCVLRQGRCSRTSGDEQHGGAGKFQSIRGASHP